MNQETEIKARKMYEADPEEERRQQLSELARRIPIGWRPPGPGQVDPGGSVQVEFKATEGTGIKPLPDGIFQGPGDKPCVKTADGTIHEVVETPIGKVAEMEPTGDVRYFEQSRLIPESMHPCDAPSIGILADPEAMARADKLILHPPMPPEMKPGTHVIASDGCEYEIAAGGKELIPVNPPPAADTTTAERDIGPVAGDVPEGFKLEPPAKKPKRVRRQG